MSDQGWRPIETAPLDGTEFQAWVTRGTDPDGWWEPRCRYNDDGAFEIWGRVDYDCDGWDCYPHCVPVAWQPPPPPPNTGDNPVPISNIKDKTDGD